MVHIWRVIVVSTRMDPKRSFLTHTTQQRLDLKKKTKDHKTLVGFLYEIDKHDH